MTYVIIGVLAAAMLFGSPSVSGGIMLGLVIAAGLAVIYSQLPNVMKRFIVKFRLLFDFGISAGVWAAVNSDTAVGLVGAATCGLIITLLLHHQAERLRRTNPTKMDAQQMLVALRRS